MKKEGGGWFSSLFNRGEGRVQKPVSLEELRVELQASDREAVERASERILERRYEGSDHYKYVTSRLSKRISDRINVLHLTGSYPSLDRESTREHICDAVLNAMLNDLDEKTLAYRWLDPTSRARDEATYELEGIIQKRIKKFLE